MSWTETASIAARWPTGSGCRPGALGGNTARVPLAQMASLWQFAYAELGDPHFGMRMAAQRRRGRLHLNDYLFEAAGTLGEGLAVAMRYAHLTAGLAVDLVVGVWLQG